MRTFLIAGTLCTLTAAAAAQEACPLAYPAFEFAVPHIDLDACPDGLAEGPAFCRASIAGDALHIFVFDDDDAQCLAALVSLDEEAFAINLR